MSIVLSSPTQTLAFARIASTVDPYEGLPELTVSGFTHHLRLAADGVDALLMSPRTWTCAITDLLQLIHAVHPETWADVVDDLDDRLADAWYDDRFRSVSDPEFAVEVRDDYLAIISRDGLGRQFRLTELDDGRLEATGSLMFWECAVRDLFALLLRVDLYAAAEILNHHAEPALAAA